MLDIQISQVGCTICSVETEATSQLIGDLTAEGAVFLQIMTSGSDPSRGRSLSEDEHHRREHRSLGHPR